MKTNLLKILTLVILVLFVASCSQSKKAEDNENQGAVSEIVPEITLTKAPASPDFPIAKIVTLGADVTPTDSLYDVQYEFEVLNYDLGVVTEDAETRGIANSAKGQHIHFIVNNGPYAAHYMPGVNTKLEAGNYVVLAFLSRSYHESVKSNDAFYVENLTVGDVEPAPADLEAPHLFYSRPKGTYSGADTDKVMLDFYLLNTTISPDGNKVRATVNGREFMIDEWAPYYMEGLPMGTTTIQLELIDADGNPIEGPFNNVTRTITLEE